MKLLLLLALPIALPLAAAAQGIGLDPSFGTRGVTRTGLGNAYVDNVYDMLVEADGRIVVVGTSQGDGSNWVSLARYLPNGRHDLTFGTGGEVLFRVDFRDEGRAISRAPGGGYLVAGVRNESNAGSGITPTVYRFTAGGAIDTTFGTRGRAVHRFDPISGGVNTAIGVQRDGSIIVAGQSQGNINGGSNGWGLRRFSANGIIDSTVVAAGVTRIPLASLSKAGRGLLDARDRMIVSGVQFIGGGFFLTLARFEADGEVDNTFGEQGTVSSGLTALHNEIPTALALDSSGRIYAAFTAPDTASFEKLAVARFGEDGFIDETYGTKGVAYVQVGGVARAHGIAITRDGKALVVGSVNDVRGRGIAARLDADGRLDSRFGTGGILRTTINADQTTSNNVAVATLEGDAFLTAGFESLNDAGDFTIARFDMLTSSTPIDERAESALTIVPNPARAGASIRLGALARRAPSIELTIVDVLGRTVATRVVRSDDAATAIDLGELPAGRYMVRAVIDGALRTAPLHVAH